MHSLGTRALLTDVQLQDLYNPTALCMLKPAYCVSGVTAATQRRWPEAERFFQALLSQDGQMASAWSNLGNVHLSTGRPGEAINDFSKAISLAPDVRTCICQPTGSELPKPKLPWNPSTNLAMCRLQFHTSIAH